MVDRASGGLGQHTDTYGCERTSPRTKRRSHPRNRPRRPSLHRPRQEGRGGHKQQLHGLDDVTEAQGPTNAPMRPTALVVLGVLSGLSLAAKSSTIRGEINDSNSTSDFALSSLVPRALQPSQTRSQCMVPSHMLWVVGTGHKTGTVLMLALLKRISAEMGAPFFSLGHNGPFISPSHTTVAGPLDVTSQRCVASKHALSEACLRTAAAESSRLIFDPHLGISSVYDLRRAQRFVASLAKRERTTNLTLRTLLLVRDPLEVILSGYFYHLTTSETWAVDPASTTVTLLHATCRRELPPAHIPWLCSTMQNAISEGRGTPPLSYQQLLTSLPAEHGIYIEALRALPQIRGMADSASAIEKASDAAMVMELEKLSEAETADAAFCSMFRFLGIDQPAMLDHCVALAKTKRVPHKSRQVRYCWKQKP